MVRKSTGAYYPIFNRPYKKAKKETSNQLDLNHNSQFKKTDSLLSTVGSDGYYLKRPALMSQLELVKMKKDSFKHELSESDLFKLEQKILKMTQKLNDQLDDTSSKYLTSESKRELATQIEFDFKKADFFGCSDPKKPFGKRYQILMSFKTDDHCRTSHFFNSQTLIPQYVTPVSSDEWQFHFVFDEAQKIYGRITIKDLGHSQIIDLTSRQLGRFALTLSFNNFKKQTRITFTDTFPNNLKDAPFPEEIQSFMLRVFFKQFPRYELIFLDSTKLKCIREFVLNKPTIDCVVDYLRENKKTLGFTPNGGNTQNVMAQLRRFYGDRLQPLIYTGEANVRYQSLFHELSFSQVYRLPPKDSTRYDRYIKASIGLNLFMMRYFERHKIKCSNDIHQSKQTGNQENSAAEVNCPIKLSKVN